MIWGTMSSAGVGPLCFLKTNVTAPVYQDILEHFMLPSADQLFKDADFTFQQDLAPAHTAKSTKSWLNDHGVGVLANSPDLNPLDSLMGKMRNKQWWSVTKYNYFVTVLKYIFQVSVLYWSSFILSNFYFYFTTFQSIRSYFLLHYIS